MNCVHGGTVFTTRSSLAEIMVLVGDAILPVPGVPASTRIAARLKSVHEHTVSILPHKLIAILFPEMIIYSH